jgi:Uncharacterised protein family (UPF0172)
MSKTYSADNTALLKILLHSAKYATSSVNGVLLGKITSSTEDAKDSAAGSSLGQHSEVAVFDVVPLGHSYLSLAPLYEICLLQVYSTQSVVIPRSGHGEQTHAWSNWGRLTPLRKKMECKWLATTMPMSG